MRGAGAGDNTETPSCLLTLINGYGEEVLFVLPPTGTNATGWKVLIDTRESTPSDAEREPHATNDTYALGARSVVVLMACEGGVP
jgi:hypothetical protein